MCTGSPFRIIKYKKVREDKGEYRRGVHERESDSSCLSSGKRKPYAF